MLTNRERFTKYRKEQNMQNNEKFLSIKEAADFLGLKYHHTRKLLLKDSLLVCYEYGRTKRWELNDIIAFKERHATRA